MSMDEQAAFRREVEGAIRHARAAAAPLTTELPAPPRGAVIATTAGTVTALLGRRSARPRLATACLLVAAGGGVAAVLAPRMRRRRECRWLLARTPRPNGRAWAFTILVETEIRAVSFVGDHLVLLDDADALFLIPRRRSVIRRDQRRPPSPELARRASRTATDVTLPIRRP